VTFCQRRADHYQHRADILSDPDISLKLNILSSSACHSVLPSAYYHIKHLKREQYANFQRVFRYYQNYLPINIVHNAVNEKYYAKGKLKEARALDFMSEYELFQEFAPFTSDYPEIEEKYPLVYSLVP
jgi:hypothetical protein